MSWQHREIVEFVKKGALPADRDALLQAISKNYSKGVDLIYYSMPDWLDGFELQKHAEKTPFASLVAEYRHAAKNYREKVAGVLDEIKKQPSGQALLDELGATRFSVRIMPYWHSGRWPGREYFRASTSPLTPREKLSYIMDGLPSNDRDAYQKGAPVRDNDSEPLGRHQIGTGKGANAVVFFTAEPWGSAGKPEGVGYEADEVLFHELVHVTRILRGQMTYVKVEGNAGYRNVEEYLATVITNVYMSDKGKTMLRGIYANEVIRQNKENVAIAGETVMVVIDPLPKNWNVMRDPARFYYNPDRNTVSPRQLMQEFKGKQGAFYRALAHLPKGKPSFNPVKQHYEENLRPDI